MDWVLLSEQFSLLNFAVSSILSLQALKDAGPGQGALGKIAFFLFLLATFSAILALSGNLIASSRFAGTSASAPSLALPLGLGLAVAASLLAAGARLWFKVPSLTAFAAPLATLFLLGRIFTDTALTGPVGFAGARLGLSDEAALSSFLLAFHIAGATMGQLLALASSLVAILYLWQRRLLKQRLLDHLTTRVPAMDILAKIMIAGLWAGFLFLTAALLSGAYFMQLFMHEAVSGGGGTYAYREKFLWASSVWAWYLVALLARNVLHLPLKRVAQMCLVGFFLLALSFFGWGFLQAGGV